HTRGTPPNVVETDPLTWIRLATGARPRPKYHGLGHRPVRPGRCPGPGRSGRPRCGTSTGHPRSPAP
ncbi:hypothetical protein ACWC9U_38575, partial [Streptomyces sp. 900116325]